MPIRLLPRLSLLQQMIGIGTILLSWHGLRTADLQPRRRQPNERFGKLQELNIILSLRV